MVSELSEKIRVLLADDHEMVRDALARVLEESGEFAIVGQASNAAQTIEQAKTLQPEVVVLDHTLPDRDAPTIMGELLDAAPLAKVLVLTVHENIHYAVRVLESGAHGYVIKSAAVDELLKATSEVRAGNIYLSSKIANDVLQHLRRPKRERVGVESLSKREFDFLRLIGAGSSLQQCAKEMGVAVSTASTYRSRIMEKLNLNSTADVIRFAIEQGLTK